MILKNFIFFESIHNSKPNFKIFFFKSLLNLGLWIFISSDSFSNAINSFPQLSNETEFISSWIFNDLFEFPVKCWLTLFLILLLFTPLLFSCQSEKNEKYQEEVIRNIDTVTIEQIKIPTH